jgi:serine/threonine protein kinase
MHVNKPQDTFAPPEGAEPAPLDTTLSRAFGFDDDVDAWVRRVADATRAPTPEELGTIAGFRLLAVVARGGQGTVYRASEPGTGRIVALKRLHLDGGGTSARARFDREAEVVASLKHPGIVTLLARHEVGEQRVLVMEWIDGQPIDRWADGVRGADSTDAGRAIVSAFAALADAVAYAHRNGVIHRDIKPSNVLVDEDGHAHVLDFGLALPSAEDASVITQASGFLGTPVYAAPEQVAGQHVDARADVHAVGALLYRGLTGAHPFDDKAPLPELFRQIAEVDPIPPSRMMPPVGRELSLVCMKALAKEPERRYETMDALAADLRRWLNNEPVLAHPTEFGYILRKAVARHRLAFSTAAVALSLLLIATVVSAWLALSLSTEREALLESRQQERIAKVAAQAGAEEAMRRAREAQRAQESAERARDFLQGIFSAMRDAGLEDSRVSIRATLELARTMLEVEKRPPQIEGELRETLGAAFEELGDAAFAIEEYQRAVSLLAPDPHADLDVLARARIGLGRQLSILGRGAEAMEPLTDALTWYQMNADDGMTSESMRLLATTRREREGPLAALPTAEESVEIALRSGDSVRIGAAMSTLALIQQELGYSAEAYETSSAGVACVREHVQRGDPELARALHNHAYLALAVDRYADSIVAAREAIAVRESIYGPRAPALLGTAGILIRAMRQEEGIDAAIDYGHAALTAAASEPNIDLRVANLSYHWLRLLEERGTPRDHDEILVRSRPLIDQLLRSEGPLLARVIDLTRVRTRVLARTGGEPLVQAMLVEEPEHWRRSCGGGDLAPAMATLATLSGAWGTKCLSPDDLLTRAERLYLELDPLLTEDDSNRVAVLRLLGDAREFAGDFGGAVQARRLAHTLAVARWGSVAPNVRAILNSLSRVEKLTAPDN